MGKAMTMMICAGLVVSLSMAASAKDLLKGKSILFLTKTEGFEHSPVAQKGDAPSFAGAVLAELAKKHGATFLETKDASLITAENLKNYDILALYTQGDIRQSGGKDGFPGMGDAGLQAMLDWVKAGGLVLGFHSATDTLRHDGSEFTKMIGGAFITHGKQFKGTIKAVDPAHPTMKHIPDGMELYEEWYMFQNLNKEDMRVLALLDPGKERARQEIYNVPNYPIIWVSAYGQGKVYSTALGHREDVWTNPTFQDSIVDAMKWLLDKDTPPEQTKPNYAEVVPESIEKAEK